MKVGVKLFGALPAIYGGSQHQRELEFDLPDGARVQDLIDLLNIHDLRHVVITRQGRILQAGDELKDGDFLTMFQPVYGG